MIDLLDIEKAEPQGKLLTIAKFAKLAGLPVSTIRYWMKEGKIETLLKKTYGNPLPVRPRDRLNRLQFKLEQMVARYKQSQAELNLEHQNQK